MDSVSRQADSCVSVVCLVFVWVGVFLGGGEGKR